MVSRMFSIAPVAVLAGLVLAGCGSTNSSNMSGMMNGDSTYSYSRLTCSAPTFPQGQTVNVTLADMGMTRMMGGTAPMGAVMMLRAAPAVVPAGHITLVASNVGWRTHELIVLPLISGSAGQKVLGPDGKVSEAGTLGEASGSCSAGAGEGIRAGTVGWTTITLPPGHYELLCNLANHYADGMHQELIVT
jgi:uncharacterized cupredoxin-like copper-binding protein